MPQANLDPTIQGVLFDMDGVLLESEPFLIAAASRMFAEKGVEVADDEYTPYFGMGEDHLLEGVAKAKGVDLDLPAAKARVYDLYLADIPGKLGPLPGVHEFIRRCKAKGLRIALASSGDRRKVEGNLKAIRLTEADFDAVVTGSDVKEKKPDPAIFLEAARRIGLDPRVCLVVEDAISGVEAAKAAGAQALGLTTNYPAEKLREAGADWIAADLAHAPDEVLDW